MELRVSFPKVALLANKFVVEAFVEKKFVVVAFVPVAFTNVRFWRVVEPLTRRLLLTVTLPLLSMLNSVVVANVAVDDDMVKILLL